MKASNKQNVKRENRVVRSFGDSKESKGPKAQNSPKPKPKSTPRTQPPPTTTTKDRIDRNIGTMLRNFRAKEQTQGLSSVSLSHRFDSGSLSMSVVAHDTVRVRGVEFLQQVKLGATTGSDKAEAIVVNRVNRCDPPNTRLAALAQIYSRWSPVRYRYRFVPCLGSTARGTLIFGQDPDVMATYVTGSAGNVARLRVLPGSRTIQIWEPATSDLAPSRDYTSLWTIDPEVSTKPSDRLDLAGRFVLAIMNDATDPYAGSLLDTTIGSLELEYDFLFHVPRLSAPVTERTHIRKIAGSTVDGGQNVRLNTSGIIANVSSTILNAAGETFSTLINDVMKQIIQNAISNALGESGIGAALQGYKPVDAALLPSRGLRDKPVSDVGWPAGNYVCDVVICPSPGTFSSSTQLYGSVLSEFYEGASYAQDTFIPGEPSFATVPTAGSWISPEGVFYTAAQKAQFRTEFGINSQGFRDISFLLQWSDPSTSTHGVNLPFDVWLSIKTADAASYTNQLTLPDGSSATVICARKSPRPSLSISSSESKDEKKEDDSSPLPSPAVVVPSVRMPPQQPPPRSFPVPSSSTSTSSHSFTSSSTALVGVTPVPLKRASGVL